MRQSRYGLALAAVLLLMPLTVRAQGDTGRRGNQGQGAMRGRQGRGQPGAPRARIQRQIREAFTRAVRTQVGLSDAQMRKLAPINRRYVVKRQTLQFEERSIRLALREQLMASTPDQDSVAKLSRRLQDLPRERLDVNAAEEQELSAIMTPVQLARYRALEERVQRQMNAMRPSMMGGDARPLPIPDSTEGGGDGLLPGG